MPINLQAKIYRCFPGQIVSEACHQHNEVNECNRRHHEIWKSKCNWQDAKTCVQQYFTRTDRYFLSEIINKKYKSSQQHQLNGYCERYNFIPVYQGIVITAEVNRNDRQEGNTEFLCCWKKKTNHGTCERDGCGRPIGRNPSFCGRNLLIENGNGNVHKRASQQRDNAKA